MDTWKGLEPKWVTVVVHRAVGLISGGKGKYMIAYGTGKKKQLQSQVCEDANGNPTFVCEAKVRINDVSDPLVLLVTDKKVHCGQVIVPVSKIAAKPEGGQDPLTYFPKRWAELEPTKKQSNPKGHLEYTCWVEELKQPSGKDKTGGSGLKALLSRSKLDIRRQSGSRPSVVDISVSTPHLLQPNGSFSSSHSGKPKKGTSPLSRFKFRRRKSSRASSRSDLDSIDGFGVGSSVQGGSIFDDGASSMSGISLDEPNPPPVPPHANGQPQPANASLCGSSFSSYAGAGGFKARGSDPFAGRNPFETGDETDYRGKNPFEEEDTTDLDALNSMTENPPSTGVGGSRRASSSGSEYSLDGGVDVRSERATVVSRVEAGLTEEAVAAAVEGRRPVILSVTPMEASGEPGTVVQIEGRYLAKGATDIESVYLADCELKGDNIQYLTASKIKVFTRRWYPTHGPIYIKTYSGGKIHFGDKEFVFYDRARKNGSKPSQTKEAADDEEVFEWNEQVWLQRAGLASRKNSVDRPMETSNMSENDSVHGTGKRYRKASRCLSNTSRSMYHLASGLGGEDGGAEPQPLPVLTATPPKIKASGTKSPGGSWGRSLAGRISKSVTDLAQPFLHKKTGSKGSRADLSEAFGETGDGVAESRNNSTKKKASACAARIERKNENTPNGHLASSVSMSALEEENRRLLSEMENLKRRISDLETNNQALLSAKKDREDYIDRLQTKLIEANCVDFLCIDRDNPKKTHSTT